MLILGNAYSRVESVMQIRLQDLNLNLQRCQDESGEGQVY